MGTITTRDGTEIYYKDWGSGQPVVFSHGWPLSADAWDDQMLFLAARGFRCIAHDRAYDCVKAFSETDHSEDLKKMTVPTLFIHGDDDQIVPIAAAAQAAVRIAPNARLKVYPGRSHGLCSTQKDEVNADLLSFLQS